MYIYIYIHIVEMVDLKSGKLWGLDGFRSFSGSCQVSKIWCPKSTTNFLLLFRGNQSGILFFFVIDVGVGVP